MAKKRARSRRKSVPSVKGAVARALSNARSLRGKVVQAAELNALIKQLEAVKEAAAKGCPTRTFTRSFSLISTSKKR